MARIVVVAEYRDEPSEGMQVISKTLVDALRVSAHSVRVIEPSRVLESIWSILCDRPRALIFTHGPGVRVVALSWLARRVSRCRIVWVASRPNLGSVPRLLRRRRTAHLVICNRRRQDLLEVARDAEFVEQFIGIDPGRVTAGGDTQSPWPELTATGRPILLHVGHLKRNRGLEKLAEVKRCLGDEIEVVVQGSPAMPPDEGVIEELLAVGVRVRRTYVPKLSTLYRAADLYVFPVQEASAGAIELPLGVLEALACKTPVLSTDFGVLRKALIDVPGVTFFGDDDLLPTLRSLIQSGQIGVKPAGLPDHLHVDRVTDILLKMLTAKSSLDR